MKIKKKYFNLNLYIIPFLLGFLTSQNTMYVFKINNTYINLFEFFGFAVFLYNLISNSKKIITAWKQINIFYKLFNLILVLSVLNLIITVITYNGVRYSSFFAGLITYGLALFYMIDVVRYSNRANVMIKGVYIGIVINIIICILQFIAFNAGNYFSLYNLFPQNAYQICIKYGSLAQLSGTLASPVFYYRASGMFLECSHFCSYLAVMMPLLFLYNKKKTLNLVLIIAVVILMILSLSGATVALFLSLLIYFILDKKSKTIRLKSFLLMFAFLLLTIVIISTKVNLSSVWENLVSSLEDAKLTGSDNVERFQSMKMAFELYLDNPIGIGANMSSSIIKSISNTGLKTTFNYFLTILLELGPMGLITYLMFIFKSIKKHFPAKSSFDVSVITGIISIVIVQFGTGVTLPAYILFMYALSCFNKEVVDNLKLE